MELVRKEERDVICRPRAIITSVAMDMEGKEDRDCVGGGGKSANGVHSITVWSLRRGTAMALQLMVGLALSFNRERVYLS